MSGARQNRPSTKKPRGLGRATVELRTVILDVLAGIDGPATVRQVYYLVSTRGAVAKDDTGYRQVQRQVLAMRREGLIDYGRIADNVRRRIHPVSYDGLGEALDHTAAFYRQSLWRDLPVHVEVWTEKDALVGVLAPVTARYDVPLLVARGYSSETFAWSAAEEMRAAWQAGKVPVVYYIGDFDPSGVHMAEDLERKLRAFIGPIRGVLRGDEISFERLAVTPDQLEEFDLPTRPTKRTDTRTAWFEDRFGRGAPSVEVDAIHPDTLRRLLTAAIEAYVPDRILQQVEAEEDEARRTLAEMAANWRAA